MNRVLDVRRPRRRRPAPDGLGAGVSVLRWPSGRAAGGVFEMFSAQEAGRFGPLEPECLDVLNGENALLVTASRRTAPETPAVLLSLVNTSPSQAVKLALKLAGRTPRSVTGTILTAPPARPRAARARKSADAPAAVPRAFYGAVLRGKVVEITVPARSVVVLTVEQRSSGAVTSASAGSS